jgi:hypothetical protein
LSKRRRRYAPKLIELDEEETLKLSLDRSELDDLSNWDGLAETLQQ